MRIIDAHVHLYPDEVNQDPAAWAARAGEPHWAVLCTRRRKDGSPVQAFPSVAQLLRDMDSAGIERSVLLGWYWEKHENCAAQNRFYSELIRQYPDRLSAFATVHPSAGTAAIEEVRRASGEGFVGLGELSPHSQHVDVADAVWCGILSLAGELNLPVNLHVTDPGSRDYPGRVETPPDHFVRFARSFPGTRFILAHWGGGLGFDSELFALKNVWFDTAAAPLIYGESSWTRGAAATRGGRVLFGSDYPLRLFPGDADDPGVGLFVGQASGAGESVLGATARTLLRLP